MPRRAMAVLWLPLLAASPAYPAVIHVPGDQPTIQAGVDSSAAGDTVVVACGIYYEHDITIQKPLVLRGHSGSPECVTIDAQQQGRGLLVSGVDAPVRLEGLTVRNGSAGAQYSPRWGGGVCIEHCTQVELGNCWFVQNHADWRGGGLLTTDSGTTARECRFSQNHVGDPSQNGPNGGGCHCSGGSLSMIDCVVSSNHSSPGIHGWGASGGIGGAFGGTFYIEGCSITDNSCEGPGGGGFWAVPSGFEVRRSVFARNRTMGSNFQRDGGGLRINGGYGTIVDCLVVENESDMLGAGLAIRNTSVTIEGTVISRNTGDGLGLEGKASVSLDSSIISDNTGPAVTCIKPSSIDASCTDVYGNLTDWAGCLVGLGVNGNFSADPYFCDPENGDFTLSVQSPCLPGNHPDGVKCGLIGALGEGCGPVSVDQETWAKIKARYR